MPKRKMRNTTIPACRKITKDDGDSEPEDRDPDRAFDPSLTAGVFQKASSEEMSRRRIVR